MILSQKRLGLLLVLLAGAGIVAPLWAQDKKPGDKEKPAPAEKKEAKDTPAPKGDSKGKEHDPAELEEWMKMNSPGEGHKKLEPLVGTWNLTVKFTGEGMTESKGKAEFKWALEGRFLVETTKTDLSGHTFEWMGWHGYDNQKKQYVSAWVDNFGTSIDTMTGRFDDAKKTLTYVGESENPHAAGKMKVKWVIKLESKDRFSVEMFEGAGNGHENKVMEIVATRG